MTARTGPTVVAVTGVGAISAAGTTGAELLAAVRAAPTSPREVELPDDGRGLPAGVLPDGPLLAVPAAEPDVRELLGRRGVRALNRESRLFGCAGVSAVAGPGAALGDWEPDRVAVVCGTLNAGLADYVTVLSVGMAEGPERINPMWGPRSGFNAPAAQLAILLGITGPTLALTSGDAAGLAAICAGAELIESGRVDQALAGGVDVISRAAAAALPPGGPPPGEGAAVLVLENHAEVVARGGRPLATIAGRAESSTERAERAVRDALAEARGVTPELAVLDVPEGPAAGAVARVLADLDEPVPILRPATVTGRALGADGAFGAAVAALALADGTAHRTPRGALCVLAEPGGRTFAVVLAPPDDR